MHKAVNQEIPGRDRAGLSRKRKLDSRSSHVLHVILRTVKVAVADLRAKINRLRPF
jgi:hypothetical protein